MSAELFRLAIVGAEDLQARALTQALKEGGVDASHVVPLGAKLGQLELSLGDDASADVFLPLERERIQSAQVVALISRDVEARSAVARWVEEREILVLDLAPPPGDAAGWFDPLSRESEGPVGDLVFPDPAALYLSRIVGHLGTRLRGPASAQMFTPASRMGEAGAVELFGQAATLLNFQPFPKEVLGRQVAFNCWPLPESETDYSDFAAQVRALSRREDLALSCAPLQGPSFHCTALSTTLVVEDAWEAEGALRGCLSEDHIFGPWDAEDWPSPVDVAGQDRPVVAVRRLDAATLWVWMVFDNGRAGKGALAGRWLLGRKTF